MMAVHTSSNNQATASHGLGEEGISSISSQEKSQAERSAASGVTQLNPKPKTKAP